MRRGLNYTLAVFIGGTIGFGGAVWYRAQTLSDVAPVQPVLHPDHLTLSVERNGDGLHLTWDPAADAIRTATHAILDIADGPHHTRLDLDPEDLQSGAASYWPDSSEVSFRLEVTAGAQLASGEIQTPATPHHGPVAKPSPVPIESAAVAHGQRVSKVQSHGRDDDGPTLPGDEPSPPPRHHELHPVAAPDHHKTRSNGIVGRIPLLRRLRKHHDDDN